MAIAGVATVLFASGLTWRLFFALPPAPEGLAPIPTDFVNVEGMLVNRTMVGTAQDIQNPDHENGPGLVAVYRNDMSEEAKAIYAAVHGEDKANPDAKAEVAVVSTRALAEADVDGTVERLDTGWKEFDCRLHTSMPDFPDYYMCLLEYGNGWTLAVSTAPGLTGEGRGEDINALIRIAQAVKDNNPLERAVQTHANM